MWVRLVFMWVKPVFRWATKIGEVVINKYKAVPGGQWPHSKANRGIFWFSAFFHMFNTFFYVICEPHMFFQRL